MPPLQRGPCRVVILVDTSKSMMPRWHELAHQFIPTLLDSLPNAKEDAADVSVSIVPIRDGPEQTPPCLRFMDKRTQVQNLYSPNFGPEVSENAIWRGFERGIKLLCQPGDTSMKYLIAALTSFPGTGANAEAGPQDPMRTPWVGFANNIIKFDIRMTIIMEPVRSYKPVNDFFKYVLSSQKRQFTSPWFAYNARLHHFLISGFSKRSIIRERSKVGATGSPTTSSSVRGRIDPLALPGVGSPSQRSPAVDLSDLPIGKDCQRRPGSLVEELRRRTGFWPAGAEGAPLDAPTPKSRGSNSVRGTAQQKKRSKEREERISPDSMDGVPGSTPLQDFPLFMPPGPPYGQMPSNHSNHSTPNSEHEAYEWMSRQAGSAHSGSPVSPNNTPPQAVNMNNQLYPSMPNMQQPYSSVYPPPTHPPPHFQPPYTQSFNAQTQVPLQGAGSPVYFNGNSVPHQQMSRSYNGRPLSPPPSRAPTTLNPNYRQNVQDPSYHWAGQVPVQYISRDSSLTGWDGKR